MNEFEEKLFKIVMDALQAEPDGLPLNELATKVGQGGNIVQVALHKLAGLRRVRCERCEGRLVWQALEEGDTPPAPRPAPPPAAPAPPVAPARKRAAPARSAADIAAELEQLQRSRARTTKVPTQSAGDAKATADPAHNPHKAADSVAPAVDGAVVAPQGAAPAQRTEASSQPAASAKRFVAREFIPAQPEIAVERNRRGDVCIVERNPYAAKGSDEADPVVISLPRGDVPALIQALQAALA